ncbi:TetR/AcrR family transcriptional regulator [Allorhizobium taibaishanense]|uniref:AcrR family transcriptional regulator n=1 Tax=Allorhizobium taibaishanense TaxID=887144 RepID=A0A1Q9A7Q5_9HYPH|nr:TetR/AcrR family transcriptional regulator [Allorhizobium taibaishanense]MBB4008174.1 AcrR family transcriptional regulator [Allorhizobium taibaishanense]OLP50614.1 hypothetical protein BJF91_15235 [Allorhizobium taibaishanense]
MSEAQSDKKIGQKARGARAGRPRLGKESGREAILTTAQQCFAKRGYDGVNIRDLAQRAGVNIALANYHFGSKAALWQACLHQLQSKADEPVAEIKSLADAAAPYPQRLVSAYATFICFNAELPDYGLFILQEMLQSGERQELVKTALIDPFGEALIPLLAEGVERGLVQTEDVSLMFFTHSIAISHVVAAQGLVASFFTEDHRRTASLRELLNMMIRSATGIPPKEVERAVASTRLHR